MQDIQKENKMGVMPVNRLLVSMSLPMMLSMIVQALYNVVDSIFVSRLSEDALTAVTLAFPVQSLMIAFGSGLGVGINAMLSKSLGEKNRENVNDAVSHGMIIVAAVYVIFLCIGAFGSRLFMNSQTDISGIADDGASYLSIVCICSFGLFSQFLFERLLQSTGRTLYTMITQSTGAVINIILDPILIFGLFGAPELGVAGAAAATVTGQCAAALLALFFNLRKNPEITISLRGIRWKKRVFGRILAVGIPSVIMQAISSVMNLGMNAILISFSSTAVAVFGIYFKLQSFVFMPVFGLNNGMVPIVSYNYGAASLPRVKRTIKLTICTAMAIMAVGCLIFQLFPQQLLMFFNASEEMLSIGPAALRIIGVTFPLAGFCIIAGSMFQAIGNPLHSLVVSVCRQLVVLLPSAYLLSLSGRLELVWLSFPIAEVVSLTLTAIFLRQTLRAADARMAAR